MLLEGDDPPCPSAGADPLPVAERPPVDAEVSALASGTLLSAAGEVIAFLPNALGRALLHDERLTD